MTMRQKALPTTLQEATFPQPQRLARYSMALPEDLPLELRHQYSAMKYGDPEAVRWWAWKLAEMILADPSMNALYTRFGHLCLAPSAHGAVPTAAATLTVEFARRMREAGWSVSCFHIHRQGGFERTNYGALGVGGRKRAMRVRTIRLEADVVDQLAGKFVLVIDDLRCTGTHERMIAALFARETTIAALAFGYCIRIQGAVETQVEESLNHAWIQRPADVLPLFAAGNESPLINARMLKFILMQTPGEVQEFCAQVGTEHGLRLYHAALSADAYFDKTRFRPGFDALEAWLFQAGALARRESCSVRNREERKVVVWNLSEGATREFVCAETGSDLQEEVALYSRFKFGDVEAIRYMGKQVAGAMVEALQAGGSLMHMFERAAAQGEFVHLVAPGVRNVLSASNCLLREVGLRVNVWLTQQGWPTMILRTLGRLGSGRENYAQLTADQRSTREKSTQTLLPLSDYQAFPSHVIFVDDVEVSGQTVKRTRELSLAAGALSFHAVLAFRVHPALAREDAGIEHRMNQCRVSGGLDAVLAAILAHPDYQPVQRMLRLLLHPQNQDGLQDFLEANVSDAIALRLYLGAMANDYLWIQAQQPGERGTYAHSLETMRAILRRRGVLDERGLPRH